MLFPFENISNDRNQERKLNNNPNWLERCNSIELSFSTSFSLAKSLSKLLKIRSVYRNYETSLSRTIYLSSRANDRYYNVHCVFPEWTKVIPRLRYHAFTFQYSRNSLSLSLCHFFFFLSFFLIFIPILLFAIVIHRVNEKRSFTRLVAEQSEIQQNSIQTKFSKWNLIFDRIKRKKFVSKGLRGKLRREIELDENEVVPSPVVDSINSASTPYTCVTSVNDLSYITMYIYNSNNNNNNYNVIIMRAWRGTRAVPRRSFRFISLFVGEIDL